MTAIDFKELVFRSYKDLLKTRIGILRQSAKELDESAANETKRTAGDKHETALAMLQIEQQNNRKQLADTLEQENALNKIDINIISQTIVKGSLIQTDRGYFFLSLALGKIIANENKIMSVSAESPLGNQFIGLKKGASVIVNGSKYLIEAIY